MTDVRNRGSMLDGVPRLLFLPLELPRCCMSVNGVEETKGFPLTHVECMPLAQGWWGCRMHFHRVAEPSTLYAIAECLPIDYSNYGDFSIICC